MQLDLRLTSEVSQWRVRYAIKQSHPVESRSRSVGSVVKTDQLGYVVKAKAQHVAKEFSEVQGVDFIENFGPMP